MFAFQMFAFQMFAFKNTYRPPVPCLSAYMYEKSCVYTHTHAHACMCVCATDASFRDGTNA